MTQKAKVGLVASSYDLFHAGHVLILKETKELCDYVIAALQTDPTVERSYKNKPVQTLQERYIQLEGCKYVDEVIVYTTEEDLANLILRNDVELRVKGSDHKGNCGPIDQLTPIHYHDRTKHTFSSSSLRDRVWASYNDQKLNQ